MSKPLNTQTPTKIKIMIEDNIEKLIEMKEKSKDLKIKSIIDKKISKIQDNKTIYKDGN